MGKNNDLYFDMPEYNNVDLPNPAMTVMFKFRNEEDYNQFYALIKEHVFGGLKVFDGRQCKDKKTGWYPLLEKASKYEYR
jgi:hypothetical protein